MADLIAVAGDLVAIEHSALPENIVVVVEPSTSNYTVAMVRNVVVAQTAVVDAMV